ncbi:SHOCT domain-containing protein [Gillisia sp. Q332]|uniref:SHOCT domain-containing protein n=1 Tax=Gillisia xinjiangensis TaxID=3384765 RepID=UPI00391B81E2
MDDFGHGWGMGWGWLLGLIILILLIWLIMRVVGQGIRPSGLGEKSALDILKERYASGEIDKKEYEDKKRDLN